MPRQARLDAPGTLHHVIIRGLERRAIVQDDTDPRPSPPASVRPFHAGDREDPAEDGGEDKLT